MVYLISYQLNKNTDHYTGLFEKLKKHESWWHYIDCTWFVVTDKSAKDIYTNIAIYLDKNDAVLIMAIEDVSMYGFLPEDAWKWIEEHTNLNVNLE